MKRERRNLFHRTASLMLAVVMVCSAIVVMPKDVSAAVAKTLPAGGGVVAISDAESTVVSGQETIISYTAAKDGYLQLTFSNATAIKQSPINGFAWGEVMLYSASGSALSPKFTYDTSDAQAAFFTEAYGVKKGTAYQIRVSSAGGVNVNAKFTASKKKESKNTKKGKAVNLKRKKKTVGVITSGTTTSHWYKFKVTKNQKLNVGITAHFTGSVKVSVSGPGIKKGGGYITSRWTAGTTTKSVWGLRSPFGTKGKVKTGTYYIQIKPTTRTCGGYFKVDWK